MFGKKNSKKILNEKFIFIFLSSLIPLFIFLNRFLIPDYSFDSLYYHLFNGVRGFENYLWPFSKNEFYPVGFGTVSPIYDSLIYIFRLIAGYRLGTIIDLVSYVGIIWLVYLLLHEIVRFSIKIPRWLKFVLFFNATVVTELLFQVSTQYVDIINTFLVMLSLLYLVRYLKNHSRMNLFLATILVSVSFLAKPTNLIYVTPFYGILLADTLTYKKYEWKYKITILFVVGILISIPTLIYGYINFRFTGNPLFPMYNNIFHSIYSAPISFSAQQSGVGGQSLLQKIFWPIASFWHPSGLAEPHSIFNDWKLGLYWLISFVLLIPAYWKKLSKFEKYTIFYFLISVEVWSFILGIMRYASVDIILGGIIMIIFLVKTPFLLNIRSYSGILVPIVIIMIFDNYRIVSFNLKYDMSWRPSLVQNTSFYLSQKDNLFNNYLTYPDNINRYIKSSQIFLECVHQSSGLIALSGFDNKPVLSINTEPPTEAITGNSAYRRLVAEKISEVFGDKNVSFTTYAVTKGLDVEYQDCLNNLSIFGATITNRVALNNFLGYPNEKVIVLFGRINLDKYAGSYFKP